MNSLIIGVAILVTLVLLARAQRRRGGGLYALFRDPMAAPAPRVGQASMPRLGRPHTMTNAQRAACAAIRLTPDPRWSAEEADLILDAVAYLRAVCREAVDEPAPAIDIQNTLLLFILADAELRDVVRTWGAARRRDAACLPPLPQDVAYGRVTAKAAELLWPDSRQAAVG
jgi:hypothetical protein